MYIIRKEVSGFYYYWNQDKKQWFGLKNNATRLTDEQSKFLIMMFMQQSDNPKQYSITK